MSETVLEAGQQRHLHSRTKPSIIWSRVLVSAKRLPQLRESPIAWSGLISMGGLKGSDSHLSPGL